MGDLVSPWVPMTEPIDLKYLGKLAEELGEAMAAVSRCVIQGIDEKEPVTGKLNKLWLQEELSDVLANIELVRDHFKLDGYAMASRIVHKINLLKHWHNMLPHTEKGRG
jgi:NTP pyrophosphatase (non-canonical NTP hydrolase)